MIDDQNQALFLRTLLYRQQSSHRYFAACITTETPNCFCGTGYHSISRD
jgi:hypothetical protein